ncbi:MAG: serpin family protein, partial [Acidimicrobiia bacterium]
GLTNMFDPDRADFTPMSKEELYMSWVLHRADLTVDEKGTIASAATAGGMKTTAAPIRNEVVIDKPFVVAIVDNNTSAILFLGQITNPGGS